MSPLYLFSFSVLNITMPSAHGVLCPPQEKEMEKQRLLYQQSRLHNRGAAEMVLQMISACKGSLIPYVQCVCKPTHTVIMFILHYDCSFLFVGETGPMVSTTLKLGISILNGGNSEVQRVCVLKKTC